MIKSSYMFASSIASFIFLLTKVQNSYEKGSEVSGQNNPSMSIEYHKYKPSQKIRNNSTQAVYVLIH